MQRRYQSGKTSDMCRRIGFGIALLAGLGVSMKAEARLSTGNYTCSDVKDLIFQQGAITLNTKDTSVYERFVADRSFCRANERLQRVNVPSKSERCRLQFCRPRNDND